MARTKNATYITIKDVDGELKSISETAFNKGVEAQTYTAEEAIRRQTFAIYEAESVDEILELAPNPAVAADLFNRGSTLKQLNEIRDLMESPTEGADAFAPVEGVYDLKGVINEVRERRKMTPLEKALRDLAALSDEDKQRIVAQLLGAQAPATA